MNVSRNGKTLNVVLLIFLRRPRSEGLIVFERDLHVSLKCPLNSLTQVRPSRSLDDERVLRIVEMNHDYHWGIFNDTKWFNNYFYDKFSIDKFSVAFR